MRETPYPLTRRKTLAWASDPTLHLVLSALEKKPAVTWKITGRSHSGPIDFSSASLLLRWFEILSPKQAQWAKDYERWFKIYQELYPAVAPVSHRLFGESTT